MNGYMKTIVTMLAALVGCSSTGSSGSPTTTISTASCVAKGASYIVHYVERSGGQCGPVPDGVTNTSADGTITLSATCSGGPEEQGCDVLLNNVKCTTDSSVVTESGKVTWAPDGSSASGTIQFSVTLNDGASCVSSYEVTWTRQ